MNIRNWVNEDFKKYIEENSKCIFIDTWIRKKTNPNGNNKRYLKLKCECGEVFDCPWVEFNSKIRPRKQCPSCSKIIGHKKKTINDKHYEQLKLEKGITIKHLEPYKGRTVKIAHECPVCKKTDWIVTPAAILNKRSKCCKKCSDDNRRHTDEWYVSRKKELGINIENIEPYKGLEFNIKHKCPICGDDWFVAPHRILSGNSKRCLKCSYKYRTVNMTKTSQEVNDFIKSVNCEWVGGEYKNQLSILEYKCECGNVFSRMFKDFKGKNMTRCSKCAFTTSMGELEIKKYLDDNNINYNQQQKFKDLKGDCNMPLSFDFSILGNDKSIISLIEFDGPFHFKPIYSINGDKAEKEFKRQVKYDKRKEKYAKDNNIPLLRIKYTDFKNIDSILDSHFK